MKKFLGTVVTLAMCAPMLASAAEGWVIADISLQAGPDTEYPSIMELNAGTPVSIQGCIEGWTWCDVIAGPDRGWVPGTFLEEAYGGQRVVVVDYGPRIGIPVVSFSIGMYWDRYYHNRPFYAQRQEWTARSIQAHAPPRPSATVTAHHADQAPAAPATTARDQQRAPPTTTATTPNASSARTQSPQAAPDRRSSEVARQQQQHKPERAPQPESKPAPADEAPQMAKPTEPPKAAPAPRTAMQQKPKEQQQPRTNEPKAKDELKAPKKKDEPKKDEGGGGG